MLVSTLVSPRPLSFPIIFNIIVLIFVFILVHDLPLSPLPSDSHLAIDSTFSFHSAQQPLIVAALLSQRLLYLIYPLRPVQLYQHILILLVDPLLDQQTPVIVRPVPLIRCLRPLRQPRRARLPVMCRDLRQQVQFHQAIELAGGKLVFEAQGAEEGFIEELRAGDPDADALGGGLGVEIRVELDLGEGAVREEAGVVAVVA